jgi:5'-nucleotidase / UDP-sugar diphosphatase
MKFLTALALFLLLQSPLSGQSEKKIVILHTNDLHSRLMGFAPESAYSPLTTENDNTEGGFARIAAVILGEKKNNSESALVLDAGDFTMGTLFTSLERKTGFQLRLMREMGYDVLGLGNHEFDYGPDWIASVIRTSAEKGKIPELIAGNLLFNKNDPRDDGFEKLVDENIITRKQILYRNGVKIGIFSLVGKDASNVAPMAAPLKFTKQASYASQMVSELKHDTCGLIICLSHSGVDDPKGDDISGEDIDLARKVDGIDLIVGGHSHTILEKPIVVNRTIIVQSGEFGKYVGRLELDLTGGKPKIANYRLIPINDKIQGDSNICKLIDEQKTLISREILGPLGMEYDKPVAEAKVILQGNSTVGYLNSNLGPLVSDAIHYYVNRYSTAGTDVSMVAAGMLFDNIVPGIQAAPDIFRVMPLGSGNDNIPGYPLSRLYVTGKELKSILEILLVSYKSTPSNYCYYSGMRVSYLPDKRLFRKIKKIEIIKENGIAVNVDLSKKNSALYSVTADSYMLNFIGIIKKLSFGLVNVVPKDEAGNRVTDMKSAIIDIDQNIEGLQEGKEWLALIKYLGSMNDDDGNGIPDIDRKYNSHQSCFVNMKSK